MAQALRIVKKTITNGARAPKLFKLIGVVVSISDGIVTIVGIANVGYNETIDILTSNGLVTCLILNVESSKVSAVVLTTDVDIKPGQYAVCTGLLMRVPTGEALLGRIVNPLGHPVDGEGPISTKITRRV